MKINFLRMPVNLESEIILNNKSYEGKIENLSAKGIFMRAFSRNGSLDFPIGTIFKLKPELPEGETVSLECMVVWSEKDTLDSVTNHLGLEILEIPPLYDEFLKNNCITNNVII